jgi:hypothetical protein
MKHDDDQYPRGDVIGASHRIGDVLIKNGKLLNLSEFGLIEIS